VDRDVERSCGKERVDWDVNRGTRGERSAAKDLTRKKGTGRKGEMFEAPGGALGLSSSERGKSPVLEYQRPA